MGLTRATVLLLVAWTAGCRPDGPDGLAVAFDSYAASPAVLVEALVNGQPVEWPGTLVAGAADRVTPRGGGVSLLGYPPLPGDAATVAVTMTWVEVMTGKAWRAEVRAPVADFQRSPGTGSLRLTAIFGPNGQMIVASDPVPASAADIRLVDVGQTCGQRVRDADADLAARPLATAGLTELLAAGVPPVAEAACPAQD